jgi:hypothetical protein
MNAQGELLMLDIQSATRGITVKDKMESILMETQDQMEKMVSEASRLIPKEHAEGPNTYMEDFDQLYTMESEREVHMRHMKKDDVTITEESDKDSTDELGENVELF